MISYLIVSLAGFLTCTPLTENRPELNVNQIPQELIVDAYSVVRESFTTYEITSARSYTQKVSEAITIFDKRSRQHELYVPYDQYCKAKIISATIYDRAGVLVRKMKKEDIDDVSAFGGSTLYADQRVLNIDMIGGGFPYTVAYEYEINCTETQSYPKWQIQDYRTSVQYAELQLIHPASLSIETKTLNCQEALTDEVDKNDQRIRKWKLSKASAIRAESMGPPAYTLLPSVHFAPKLFIVDTYKGTMTDWVSFGRFIHDLNADREKLSPTMAGHVRRMIGDAKNNREKIDILYRYLQDNMRYVSVQLGIGGWQAYDAKYVEENKFGDCKALSYFMKGMLAEVGIKAWPVLVAMQKRAFFSEDFVTPGSFNHMILYLPDEDLWLECTSKLNPTGYLHDAINDRSVVCITPSGGLISRTPSYALDNTLTQTRDSIYFSEASWHLKGKRTFEEAAHEHYRSLKNYLTTTEQEKDFREDFALPIKQLNALDYSAEKDRQVAGCTYQVALTQFGSVSGSRLFLPVNPLYRFKTLCTSDRRTQGIFLDEPVNEFNEIQIHLPEGYQIESSVTTKHFTEPQFGEYHLEVNAVDGGVIIKRHLKIPRLDLSVDQYAALCAFFSSIETADKATIVLKKVAE